MTDRPWNLPFLVAGHSGSLGHAYARLGRVAEGLPLTQQALSIFEKMGHRFAQALFLTPMGEAYMLAGRHTDAREFAGKALTLARENGQRSGGASSRRSVQPRRLSSTGRRLLQRGNRGSEGARPAPARGALPSRPWKAPSAQWPAGSSACATRDCCDDVSGDGHAVLAGAGRSGIEQGVAPRPNVGRLVLPTIQSVPHEQEHARGALGHARALCGTATAHCRHASRCRKMQANAGRHIKC